MFRIAGFDIGVLQEAEAAARLPVVVGPDMDEAPVDLPRLVAEIFQIMAVRRVQRAGQQQRVIETLSSLMQLKRGILSKPLILSSFEHEIGRASCRERVCQYV